MIFMLRKLREIQLVEEERRHFFGVVCVRDKAISVLKVDDE